MERAIERDARGIARASFLAPLVLPACILMFDVAQSLWVQGSLAGVGGFLWGMVYLGLPIVSYLLWFALGLPVAFWLDQRRALCSAYFCSVSPIVVAAVATVAGLFFHWRFALIVAWPVLQLLMAVSFCLLARLRWRPNNSSKPTPLRGAA